MDPLVNIQSIARPRSNKEPGVVGTDFFDDRLQNCARLKASAAVPTDTSILRSPARIIGVAEL